MWSSTGEDHETTVTEQPTDWLHCISWALTDNKPHCFHSILKDRLFCPSQQPGDSQWCLGWNQCALSVCWFMLFNAKCVLAEKTISWSTHVVVRGSDTRTLEISPKSFGIHRVMWETLVQDCLAWCPCQRRCRALWAEQKKPEMCRFRESPPTCSHGLCSQPVVGYSELLDSDIEMIFWLSWRTKDNSHPVHDVYRTEQRTRQPAQRCLICAYWFGFRLHWLSSVVWNALLHFCLLPSLATSAVIPLFARGFSLFLSGECLPSEIFSIFTVCSMYVQSCLRVVFSNRMWAYWGQELFLPCFVFPVFCAVVWQIVNSYLTNLTNLINKLTDWLVWLLWSSYSDLSFLICFMKFILALL